MHGRDITDLLESISETYPVDKLVAVPVGAHFTQPNGIGAFRANPSSILNYSQARIGETFLSTSCELQWMASKTCDCSFVQSDIFLAVFVSLILVSDAVSYLSFAFVRICNHKHFIRAATLLNVHESSESMRFKAGGVRFWAVSVYDYDAAVGFKEEKSARGSELHHHSCRAL